jgi:glycosyltransferase involved in cell wall biosynthesis
VALLSVIIPSRTRPNMLFETLGIFRQTEDIQLIVVANNCQETYQAAIEGGADIVLQNAKNLNPVISCNRGVTLATGKYLMPGSDDIQPQKGWLEFALKAHQEQLDGYGVIGLNDLMHLGDEVVIDAGLILFDRRFCRDHLGGCLVVPHYHHLFADKESIMRARALGRFYWCKEAIVAHNHPANNKRPPDELDAQRDDWWAVDEKIYLERQAAGFPDDFEPVVGG